MQKFMIAMLIGLVVLTACDDGESNKTDTEPTKSALDANETNNDGNAAESDTNTETFMLHMNGQVDHQDGEDNLLEAITINSEIPVTGRLVYEGQTRSNEPRYTLHLNAFNETFPNMTQVHLETDNDPNGVIFRDLRIGLHQPSAGGTFRFPDDLTGDSYGEIVAFDYELWTVTDYEASFDRFEAEAVIGTITIEQLDSVVIGNLDLTIPVLNDNRDGTLGEIHMTVEFSDVPLENPDAVPDA